MIIEAGLLLVLGSVLPQETEPPARWYKGCTHAHTLWDNGDALPEVVAEWYRSRDYDFVVLSDHNENNALSGADRRATDPATGERVKLKTFLELEKAFTEEGCFLLIPGEEIGDSFQGRLVHHTVVNSRRILLPPGGASVRQTMARALELVTAPAIVHLNHPNLGWAVDADDIAETNERFLEIANAHPAARNGGDDLHPSTEAMWDLALTRRLRAGNGLPIYGVASDDAHHYSGKGGARPGQAWVMVRARELTTDAIVRAMDAGDFYSSTGVLLDDVRAEPDGLFVKTSEPAIIRFIGSRKGERAAILQETPGTESRYRFAGDELYVRAVATSAGGRKAWTQPVLPRMPACAEGWKLELVAAAPRVRHPSVVCCSPDGRVFVGEDPMDMEGPLDQPVDRILCLHPDGRTTVFAEGLGPVFGLMYLEGRLYVQHVPKFSVFRDDGDVGRDRVDLIECTNPTPTAGNGLNDHIPANFHLGMDGFFYVAVGQKGIYGAIGRDGKRFEMREGGILRMRPDGTGLEVFCRGTRNLMDVAITSNEELFGYDNDDHTKSWKVKLIHLVDGGYYGFPWDIKPARPWTLGSMAEFRSGAPTGILAVTEDALLGEYKDNLILCDWGRRTVTRVRIAADGATYRVVDQQDLIPPGPDDFRPVGITPTPDGLGFYVTDWNFGGWKRRKDDAGRLFKLTWKGTSRAAPKPDWYLPAAMGRPTNARREELVSGLAHPSRNVRLIAQRLLPAPGHGPAASLHSADAAIRFRAATGLGRTGDGAAVPDLLAALEENDPFVRHAVFTALHRIGDWPAIVAGLRSGRAAVREGTLFALREAYDDRVVDALAQVLEDPKLPEEFRSQAAAQLRDLERKPPPWDGRWWRNGPYAFAEDDPRVAPRIDRTVEWSGTPAALEALRKALQDPSPRIRAAAAPLPELRPAPGTSAPMGPAPPRRTLPLLAVESYAAAAEKPGDPARGRALFAGVAGCGRCHRVAGQGGDLGPDLAGVGSKYGRSSLIESVLYPSRQIAEGFQQTVVKTRGGKVVSGLIRSESDEELTLVDGEGTRQVFRKRDLEARRISELSLMPDGLQASLTVEEFVDLISFLVSLQDADEFVPLLNGKDLSGWKKDPANEGHWKITDRGTLLYDAKGTDLWTVKAYANFILKAEWRFPSAKDGGRDPVEKEAPVILPDGSVSPRTEKILDGGDSGIFLRGTPKAQVNLWCWPIGSGEVYGFRTDASLPAEVRAAATPKRRADHPPGEWNRLLITMKGSRLTVVLNDQTVIDQAELPGVPARGPIGLQRPGRPLTLDMPVEFANFRIKELSDE